MRALWLLPLFLGCGARSAITCEGGGTDPAGDSCEVSEECLITCVCRRGEVELGSCYTGRCLGTADLCPDACDVARYGRYTETFCAE